MGPFCVTRSNPTQPMGQPNPWTTLILNKHQLSQMNPREKYYYYTRLTASFPGQHG